MISMKNSREADMAGVESSPRKRHLTARGVTSREKGPSFTVLASGMASWRRWHLRSLLSTQQDFRMRRGWKFTLCIAESFPGWDSGLGLGVRVAWWTEPRRPPKAGGGCEQGSASVR